MTNHMWDGFWFLANGKSWNAIAGGPARHHRQEPQRSGGQEQREDIAELNAALQKELAAKGLAFNEVDQSPFRAKLRLGRLLQGMEGQVRRRGVGAAREVRRQDRDCG